MRSLQRRAIVGGLVWAIATLFAGTFALLSVFDTMATSRFERSLHDRHLQLVAALANAQSAEAIDAYLFDPAYTRPYSGRFWQIAGENGVTTSRSLFDATLDVPDARAPEFRIWQGLGPTGPLRGTRERIVLEDGSEWVVTVAESIGTLAVERAEIRRSLAYSFGLVGLFMILGALALTSLVLRPVLKLREDVARRWDEGRELQAADYPAEVAPLVSDIDELLHRNREIVERGRRQAADLAHALKTPSAALRNELTALAPKTDMSGAMLALDRIDAQIGRSLARMRAQNAARNASARTDLGHSLERLERLFRAMPDTKDVAFSVSTAGEIAIPVDRQDIEEMLGNVMENAFKWCASEVRVSASRGEDDAVILIEDDGPGIDARLREMALAPGARLDTAVPGTGLGLAITQDLANAYGGTLELEKSPALGGLMVAIRLPLRVGGLNPVRI